MNKKTAGSIIKAKMNAWVKSIDNAKLSAMIERDVIVTGGCIASLLLKEEVNDYDVYFRTKDTAKRVAQHYCAAFNARNINHLNKLGGAAKAFVLDGADVAEWKAGKRDLSSFADGFTNQGGETWREDGTWSRMIAGCDESRIKVIVRSDGVAAEDGKESILAVPFSSAVDAISAADSVPAAALGGKPEEEKYRPVFLSTNAITLSGKVQCIVRFYGEPDEIHKNYDFAHCTNYWTFADGLVLRPSALEALLAKELFYCGSKYPVCSMIRTRKFIKRGFHINAGQYLKMAFQISRLDLTDIDVLEDQLVGVHSAYFMILIDALRQQADKDPNFKVEEGYVASIIDMVF